MAVGLVGDVLGERAEDGGAKLKRGGDGRGVDWELVRRRLV
jgi:hypothetical protein